MIFNKIFLKGKIGTLKLMECRKENEGARRNVQQNIKGGYKLNGAASLI